MQTFSKLCREPGRRLTAAFSCGVLVLGLALAAPTALASSADKQRDMLFGGGSGGGGGGAAAGGAGTARPSSGQTDLTTCNPGQVWDAKRHKCLQRRSGVLPDPELTEYARALAEADRFQEAIDVLDLLDNPNTPRALNYRGYATRKLGRTDEGIGYYLKSVALDPNYPQVREYLGEAYVIEGKFDLAKEQLATIEKICGTDCQYYAELEEALEHANAL
jgi:tetratricopeptide (TPR) repeat protein